MIVDAGFDVNNVVQDEAREHTIIMKGLLCGASSDKIQLLIDRGANIKFNLHSHNALHFAIKGGNIGTNRIYYIIFPGT
jgi:hypothetical protein